VRASERQAGLAELEADQAIVDFDVAITWLARSQPPADASA
jgi:hypothetical protein